MEHTLIIDSATVQDREVHGNAINLDNWETHDTRHLVPGIAVSIEPGIYLPDFGARSEINLYMSDQGPEVTTKKQDSVVSINRQKKAF